MYTYMKVGLECVLGIDCTFRYVHDCGIRFLVTECWDYILMCTYKI